MATNSLPAFAAPASRLVTPQLIAEVISQACSADAYRGKRILVIVPDGTRTAPVGLLFKTLFAHIGEVASKLDVMIALGTHQPMNEKEICRRLDLSLDERRASYRHVAFINHEWDNPAALEEIGAISSDEVSKLTDGLFVMDVPVQINKRVFEYDQIIIIGPVFPHEVVGFSGGNKYLFPGVAGPRILNFFHWLGAVVTNPMIIGNKWTPVRRVVDRAGSMVSVPKLCFCMVVAPDKSLAGLFAGTPEGAWDAASELSKQIHITYKDHPFHTILSCAPSMYADLWTGGKAMYKLEPVLADGGELIIYAPHVTEVSYVHGKLIEEMKKIQKRIFENHKIDLNYDAKLVEEVAKRCTEVESGPFDQMPLTQIPLSTAQQNRVSAITMIVFSVYITTKVLIAAMLRQRWAKKNI
jgi:nickel-dependent lactate racemase